MSKIREWRSRKEMLEMGYPAVVIDRIRHSEFAPVVIRRTGTARNSKILYDRIEFESIWRNHYAGN